MKNISLRKFRVEILDIHEAVEVSRRDPDGNIQLLGFWTPYATYAPGAKLIEPPQRLEFPVEEESRPKVIRTPEEAASATRRSVGSVRAFPKDVQTGRKRR